MDGEEPVAPVVWGGSADCAHEWGEEQHGKPQSGVVFDPFLGSGTVALAAENLNRNWLGCEISEHYADMARKRLVAKGDVAGYVKHRRMERSGQVGMVV
jgi:hypothetical protein